jgi:pimeloyl-ACP methyl ester carboxylesterase
MSSFQVYPSDGIAIDIKYSMADYNNKKFNNNPLIFVHGSFHGSWCFEENFLSYFASIGFNSYAVGLRGTSDSPTKEGVSKIKIDDHVNDLADLITLLQTNVDVQPIVIGHSLGGMIVMKLLEVENIRERLAGAVLLCSIPPTGNGQMSIRFLKRSISLFWKIFRGFVFKSATKDVSLCRDLFFDKSFSDNDIDQYMARMRNDSKVTIDLADLNKKWPSTKSGEQAAWLIDNSVKIPRRLVIGGKRDLIVDEEGVIETSLYMGCEKPIFLDTPHDLMLGQQGQWKTAANAISNWLESEF